MPIRAVRSRALEKSPDRRIVAEIAPGPAISGMASGNTETPWMSSWVIARLRRVFMALLAAFEHHLEGDPEQEQAAGNAETRAG
jgi:hypothetical protein